MIVLGKYDDACPSYSICISFSYFMVHLTVMLQICDKLPILPPESTGNAPFDAENCPTRVKTTGDNSGR